MQACKQILLKTHLPGFWALLRAAPASSYHFRVYHIPAGFPEEKKQLLSSKAAGDFPLFHVYRSLPSFSTQKRKH